MEIKQILQFEEVNNGSDDDKEEEMSGNGSWSAIGDGGIFIYLVEIEHFCG